MVMADSYLAISAIANDQYMNERLKACATQQAHLGNAPIIENDFYTKPPVLAAINWVEQNKYLWAASPSWGEKWSSSLASHPDDPEYEPGKDEAVITDDDILATVQALTAVDVGE
jgi:hypothetical protein